ncbi:MAG: hypothetical protein QXL94_00405 [Candidatus Parvarchaeum sp.]
MTMKMKITQKRGRRTDSVELESKALEGINRREIEVNVKFHENIYEITIAFADLKITAVMDEVLLQDILAMIFETLPLLSGNKDSTNTSDVLSTIANAVIRHATLSKPPTAPQPTAPPDDSECTPCEQTAHKTLIEYFDHLITACNNGEPVDEIIKRDIGKIITFRDELVAGGKRARKAYKEAVEYLSHYP